ncbi:uncharacterized protein LOC107272495 isoform X2 [Cephus cinctus]|uniref:Uncharacterized protein LOC107272495 isoform X2 n=1 Tax=Cephus cinctus TaxID=211228 RepID=A0AAJ7C9P1_CEPCN|nr:uncharacterized protein LOC107272495 isoform X2 [Cephus cinctus]
MANPKWCVVQDPGNVVAHPLIKMTDRLSLGINLSIFLILTIFATLLFLPLRLLLDTNYETRQDDVVMPESVVEPRPSEPEEIMIDFRALRICPGYRYSLLIKSIYLSDYDGNCTFFIEKDVVVEERIAPEEDLDTAVVPLQEVEESAGVVVEKIEGRDQGKNSRTKSISMAGHILAAMLTVSSIVALVEVLRIRFGKPEGPSACGNVASRKGSLVDYSQRRYTHVKMQPQRSFEKQGIYTEARVQGLRLLAR